MSQSWSRLLILGPLLNRVAHSPRSGPPPAARSQELAMIQKWFGLAALMLTAMTLLSLASCARSQKLVGISVAPATATFGGVGAQLQFKAIGTYIHPPENKDCLLYTSPSPRDTR